MFWQEDDNEEAEYRVPDDVFDLLFRVRGREVDIDHAFELAEGLQSLLPSPLCARIGVHGIGLASSGNGWIRPDEADAVLPLSRRCRLAIRVRREDADTVVGIANRSLTVGRHALELGESSVRPLVALGTLHARAVRCDPSLDEDAFLAQVAHELADAGIRVKKMMCGKSGSIRAGGERISTRSLLIADLAADESVRLQQRGLGADGLLGCGLFVPHKGIAAVHRPPQAD
ncbi:MAG: type I-MYXAN CRISPR-associated protein Cas6/Cmx6 [Gammaproteobacteria bacterium]|nr:type I-MYXAN CRISPR-associated protein Cas6/Cmx6 [Gammaproteobacteria bacterium]